jgi:dGTP triphosphohydrolase
MDNLSIDVEDVLSKFQVKLEQDLKMNELDIKEKAMLAPNIKHKWVAETTRYKVALVKLEAAKKQKIKSKTVNSPVALSKAARDEIIYNDPDINTINESIEKIKLVLEYLEKAEKITSSLSYDYKNVIDLQKLETT